MVPLYHYGITLLVLAVFGWTVYRLITDFHMDRVAELLIVVSLFLTALYARLFPLGVQDRVIRLEERLRMHEVLPEELRPRIAEFTTSQLIGLRFASDGELPGLARWVLEEGVTDRTAIKKAVREWRADHQRI